MADIKHAKVQYWTDLAQYDLDTAEAMLKTKRFLYVGFMCHQSIEKILKGYLVSIDNENPPHTHNLTLLAKKSGIYKKFTDYQKGTIDQLEPLNIEARYPTHKEKLLKYLDEEKSREIYLRTKELLIWIKQQF